TAASVATDFLSLPWYNTDEYRPPVWKSYCKYLNRCMPNRVGWDSICLLKKV
uniref:Uncharacterized protein n=1 Tax=Calidris pygmaea TaxID=425635 RepID=A0A8C3KJW2_9CHAR